jgi:uncharacterized protein YndB with AHSA1/START domain
MPIKKDEQKRWVEMELVVPGTPEQVWHAMATGPGYTGWFVRAEIEPRTGGAFRLDFGPHMVSKGEVTAWEPPRRFGYVERDWAPGAPPCATEITITARSGDRCVMRMVHSLFTTADDWDDQVEGFESGWLSFFAILRLYLAHFAGSPASSFIVMEPVKGDDLSVWRSLCETLGLTGANVNERREARSGPEPWSGTVEHIYQDGKQRGAILRLDAPSPGIALVGTSSAGGTTTVNLSRYYYGEGAAGLAAEGETRWRDWLAKAFAG